MPVEDLNFLSSPRAVANGSFCVNQFLALDQNVALLLVRPLVHASNDAVQLFYQTSQVLQVFLEKLVCNDLHVPDWVDFSLVMHDVLIRESSDDVIDAVNSLDVGQERVAKAFTFASTSN